MCRRTTTDLVKAVDVTSDLFQIGVVFNHNQTQRHRCPQNKPAPVSDKSHPQQLHKFACLQSVIIPPQCACALPKGLQCNSFARLTGSLELLLLVVQRLVVDHTDHADLHPEPLRQRRRTVEQKQTTSHADLHPEPLRQRRRTVEQKQTT